MEATVDGTWRAAQERWAEQERQDGELATLSAHLSAATARWLELAWEVCAGGDVDEPARYLAFRCGVTTREAHEFLRVAEALRELPGTRAAFARGALTFTKVRALTRVATAASEQSLLELADVLTASQLERALRVFRRVAVEEARETHELEYVDYHFDEDGSLYLSARLPAEDGMVLVKALEAARDRVNERRREERASAETRAGDDAGAELADPPVAVAPARSATVEALVMVAQASLDAHDRDDGDVGGIERARLVVHVDAAALSADGRGCCELEDGPVIAPETARRLGCDADLVTQVERDGLPVSVGRRRRTVPPALRRLLEARDERTCVFPGCERHRHLQAHHRRHWAHGGETSLDNLVLLCWQHHRLVHEGGYTIADDGAGELCFRNRHGVVTPNLPPRPPPGHTADLLATNHRRGLVIGPDTNRNGDGGPFDLESTIFGLCNTLARDSRRA
jgi:hypothetical protein